MFEVDHGSFLVARRLSAARHHPPTASGAVLRQKERISRAAGDACGTPTLQRAMPPAASFVPMFGVPLVILSSFRKRREGLRTSDAPSVQHTHALWCTKPPSGVKPSARAARKKAVHQLSMDEQERVMRRCHLVATARDRRQRSCSLLQTGRPDQGGHKPHPCAMRY